MQDCSYLLQKKTLFIQNISTATVARAKRFKSRTLLQVDTENLKSECNFKKPLSIKISSTIHCKRPTSNDHSSFYIVYSPQTFKIRPKEKTHLKLQLKIEIPKHIEWSIGLLPPYSNKVSIENTEEIARIKDNFLFYIYLIKILIMILRLRNIKKLVIYF